MWGVRAASMTSHWPQLESAIGTATASTFTARSVVAVGGGCIHQAIRVNDANQQFFVKHNSPELLDMFRAESRALDELRRAGSLRLPKIILCDICDGRAVLVLEYIELHPLDDSAAHELGRALASMHRTTAPGFGWHIDNFIGSSPQSNHWHDDWPTFFREERLRPQLERAILGGFGVKLEPRAERLLPRVSCLLDEHEPVPSLLHGDLWVGNAASDSQGAPVLFDPASYYGDRETDLAMTELFGGFGPAFRRGYESVWPLDPGYRHRQTLYNLYHLLNHLNLFGAGYLQQVVHDIDLLLEQVR